MRLGETRITYRDARRRCTLRAAAYPASYEPLWAIHGHEGPRMSEMWWSCTLGLAGDWIPTPKLLGSSCGGEGWGYIRLPLRLSVTALPGALALLHLFGCNTKMGNNSPPTSRFCDLIHAPLSIVTTAHQQGPVTMFQRDVVEDRGIASKIRKARTTLTKLNTVSVPCLHSQRLPATMDSICCVAPFDSICGVQAQHTVALFLVADFSNEKPLHNICKLPILFAV